MNFLRSKDIQGIVDEFMSRFVYFKTKFIFFLLDKKKEK